MLKQWMEDQCGVLEVTISEKARGMRPKVEGRWWSVELGSTKERRSYTTN